MTAQAAVAQPQALPDGAVLSQAMSTRARPGLQLVETSVRPNRMQALDLIASYFEARPHEYFPGFDRLEDLTEEAVRRLLIAGTAYEAALRALAPDNAVPSEPRMHHLIDVSALDGDDIHALACYCNETAFGSKIAGRLRERMIA